MRYYAWLFPFALALLSACDDSPRPLEPTAEIARNAAAGATLALDEADDQIAVVIAQVQVLCDAGRLKRGQCVALGATLQGALRNARAGNSSAAIGQLGAFIHQVVAFGRTGFLEPDAVQSLVVEAGKAIAALRG